METKDEELSSSSLPVIPSADEAGTKEEEAAASLPVQSTGEADEALANAVESLSLQENPLQADFEDEKMEQPPSLQEEGDKSPKADETMPDAGSKKEMKTSPRVLSQSQQQGDFAHHTSEEWFYPLFGQTRRGTQASWSSDG